MRVIILAAGMGTRMLPLTRNTPKCLLDIGSGHTLLETQLQSIAAAGVDRVSIVTGYLAEQVDAKLTGWKNKMDIETIYNPFFGITNNLVTAWIASSRMRNEDFIILNGDDIFNPVVMSGLLEVPEEQTVTMVIDRKDHYADEDMKVVTEGAVVREVSKTIPEDRANGESIGMIRFMANGRMTFADVIDSMLRDPDHLQVFYLRAVEALAQQQDVHFHEIDEADWAEIDFHPELVEIKAIVEKHAEATDRWLG